MATQTSIHKPTALTSNDWLVEPIDDRSQMGYAYAPTNIALTKYWGKRDIVLNLPTNSSLSAAIAGLGSYTTVEFNEAFKQDRFILNKCVVDVPSRVAKVLDKMRDVANTNLKVRIQSANNFPTAAGLASSASGFAALTLAVNNALQLKYTPRELSAVARLGSGSACRSVFNGFVFWNKGTLVDGSDSAAERINTNCALKLDVAVFIVNAGKKEQPSTGGMEHTRLTSPYFSSWVSQGEIDTQTLRTFLSNQHCTIDSFFEVMAPIIESNCLAMHASAMAARPPIFYWEPETLRIIDVVTKLKKLGFKLFFTIDAGPNVVVFLDPKQTSELLAHSLITNNCFTIIRTTIDV